MPPRDRLADPPIRDGAILVDAARSLHPAEHRCAAATPAARPQWPLNGASPLPSHVALAR
jgi:hypothetical protein